MTELSPAQKAVAAFKERHELCGPFDDDWVEQCLAAALGKITDEVVPEPDDWDKNNFSIQALRLRCLMRDQCLAIATELRGTTPTETP